LCKPEDFSNKGLINEVEWNSSIRRRLCPDYTNIKDFLILKNSYNNQKERLGFIIEANICNNDYSDKKDCVENDIELQEFLD
jgi:hypothetical protein